MTRVQKERFPNIESYNAVKDAFIFDADTVLRMKSEAILMHPLPRVNEISLDIDTLPQAAYFEQARNGVPIRMALIKYCLEG
jgi:aspartate carbamoyltransferase catalytic subunit